MTGRQHLSRIAVAFGISVLFNAALIGAGFLVNPDEWPQPWTVRILSVLGTPGETVAMWLLPGHSGTHIVIAVVSSVVFYAVLAWALLTLRVWRRTRA